MHRYLGNYYYNITNKLALKAAGGSTGFPLTIATLQVHNTKHTRPRAMLHVLVTYCRTLVRVCGGH